MKHKTNGRLIDQLRQGKKYTLREQIKNLNDNSPSSRTRCLCLNLLIILNSVKKSSCFFILSLENFFSATSLSSPGITPLYTISNPMPQFQLLIKIVCSTFHHFELKFPCVPGKLLSVPATGLDRRRGSTAKWGGGLGSWDDRERAARLSEEAGLDQRRGSVEAWIEGERRRRDELEWGEERTQWGGEN